MKLHQNMCRYHQWQLKMEVPISNVPISGINDKQSITAKFFITLDKKLLPMHLIYKPTNSTKISFPEGFLLSAKDKNYTNEKKSFKLLDDIIWTYIRQERKKLGRENKQFLIIYGVFRRQTTDNVLKLLEDKNILVTKFHLIWHI